MAFRVDPNLELYDPNPMACDPNPKPVIPGPIPCYKPEREIHVAGQYRNGMYFFVRRVSLVCDYQESQTRTLAFRGGNAKQTLIIVYLCHKYHKLL